jgi:hypothetical protein
LGFGGSNDSNATMVNEVQSLLTEPWMWDSQMVEMTSKYDTDSIVSLIQGFRVRNIIDGFVACWTDVLDANGAVISTAITAATQTLLSKMAALLSLTAEIDTTLRRWSESWTLMTSSGPLEERWFRFASEIRFWWYQELCLVRAELWHRYNFANEELVNCYTNGLLHWQYCWFISRKSDLRILSAINGAIGWTVFDCNRWLGVPVKMWMMMRETAVRGQSDSYVYQHFPQRVIV